MFANIVLADEINRAPAKVQSALLEVMAEHQVSIAGTTRKVPEPFLVLATQNPIESEGVYPLPEAQRDRFLMKVVVGYPTAAEEAQIVARMGGKAPRASQVLSLDDLVRLQEAADAVHVAPAVADYAVRLVLATREPGRPRPARAGRAGHRGAPAPAPPSASSPAAGPSPSCGAATTSSPRTSSTSPPTCCATASCRPTRRWPRASSVEQLLARLLSTVHAPVVAPSQDPTAAAGW